METPSLSYFELQIKLFVSCFLEFFVLVVEFINTTCCVNEFHLTCVEWV